MVSDYVLTIQLNPSQLNQQLQKLQQAMGGGTGTSQSSTTKSPFEKIMKFGVIALGVGELVKMVKSISSLIVDSSPMLKQMLNLFNNELMLMLMPIGNFIGFVLQPILLVMLRYVVLPFYRYFMPLAQRYGLTIGDGLARLIIPMLGFFTDPVGSLEGLGALIGKNISGVLTAVWNVTPIGVLINALSNPAFLQDVTNFGKALSTMATIANAWLTNQFANITGALGSLATQANLWLTQQWSGITQIFTNIYSGALGWLDGAWADVGKFFSTLGNDVKYITNTSWGVFKDFFGILSKDIAGDALTAWSDVVGFLQWMGQAIGNGWNILVNAIKSLTGGFISLPTWGGTGSSATSTSAPTAQVKTSSSTASSTQPIINVIFQDAVYGLQDFEKVVGQMVQKSYNRGRVTGR